LLPIPYVTLVQLPGGHSADELHVAMQQVITKLPGQAWLTLTWEQGSEMASHHHIASGFPEGIYFAHPGSPWQRGSNENTNGLLRQYFPKGTDLSVHDLEHLNAVAQRLNNRPQDPELADTGPSLPRCSTLVTLQCCDDR